MGHPVIEVEHLSKRYSLGEDQFGVTLREAAARSVRRLGRRSGRPRRDEIWSLHDVNFQVAEGEALGVIGRNGAGKSTLLKLLSRITEPTGGVARTRGRVAALLEVGTGFHPELTGRENVYLNAAILGMGRRAVDQRFDEIVAFAGMERFIDTPIKRYSSGMYLRLAFSVAAHLEPDILAVDEVLAVGDAEFQAKCVGRMANAEQEGRTVVFVSHNLDAIARLCPRSVWLEQGSVQAIGPTAEVLNDYLGSLTSRTTAAWSTENLQNPVALRAVTILDPLGRPVDVLRRDQPFTVEVRFSVRTSVPGLDLSAPITNMQGVEILCEGWGDTVAARPGDPGTYVARLQVPAVLNVGEYVVGVWIGTRYDTFLEEATAARIRLEGDVKGRPRRLVDLQLPWDVQRVAGHEDRSLSLNESD
jgi:ABC-type polysaccharide/polyol phosphate transport system ATPase subunit